MEVISKLYKAIPRLPMKNLEQTKNYYRDKLHFEIWSEYGNDYLIIAKDEIELHFFIFSGLQERKNYAQCYIRIQGIKAFYKAAKQNGANIPALGHLETKTWGQVEFSVIDPNGNLLTFGEAV